MDRHENATVSVSADEMQALYVRQWASLAALVLLAWDTLVMFNEEYQNIWRAPHSMTSKWIFIFMRYLGLGAQSVSTYLYMGPLSASATPILLSVCLRAFHFQIICAQGLLTALEGMLLLRVHALHGQKRPLGVFLFIVFVLETLQAIFFSSRAHKRLRFDAICTATDDTLDPFLYGIGVGFTQLITWVLTFRGRKRGGALKRNKPIVGVLLRDGSWTFACLTVVFAFIIPYSSFVKLTAELTILWPAAIFSITGCHLILNMQRLKVDTSTSRQSSGFSRDVELTTFGNAEFTTYDSPELCDPDGAEAEHSKIEDEDIERRHDKFISPGGTGSSKIKT